MRHKTCLILLAIACGVSGAATAQQLNQPRQIEPFKPISSAQDTSTSSNTLPAPRKRVTGKVRADASERASTASVAAAGPASDADRPTQPASTTPKAPAQPTRVVDAQGRLVSGAVVVGDNRVMDPKTGRVYSTIPDGDGQRIIQPTKP